MNFKDLYKAGNQLLSPDPIIIAKISAQAEKETLLLENKNRFIRYVTVLKISGATSKIASAAAVVCLIIAGAVLFPLITNNSVLIGNKQDGSSLLQEEAEFTSNITGTIDFSNDETDNHIQINGFSVENDSDIDIGEEGGIYNIQDTVEYVTDDNSGQIETFVFSDEVVLITDEIENNESSNDIIIEPNRRMFNISETEIETNSFDETVAEVPVEPSEATDSIEYEISVFGVEVSDTFYEEDEENTLPDSDYVDYYDDGNDYDYDYDDDYDYENEDDEDFGEGGGGYYGGNAYNSVTGYLNWPKPDLWDNLEIPGYFTTIEDREEDLYEYIENSGKEDIPQDYINISFKDFASIYLSGTHTAVGVEYTGYNGIEKKDLLKKDTTPFYALLSSCLDKKLSVWNGGYGDYVLFTVSANGREIYFRITSENLIMISLSDYNGFYIVKLSAGSYGKAFNLVEMY